MHLISRIRNDETGATMVVGALVLVVLLGFAAVAVDLAHKWSLQRQDQSAADTGALAGAILATGKDEATAMADATDEVERITYTTARPNMTFAEWELAWNGCVDPDKPPQYTKNATSACVSFTNNLEYIRVRLPNVDFDAAFGPVLGVNTISTSAAGEAQIMVVDEGNVLPFGIPGSAAVDEVCLKSGPNPSSFPPCDGPSQGNFGFLDITQMGNDEMGTTTQCSGNTTERLAENIAIGVDHPIGTAPGPFAPFARDRDLCPAFPSTPYTLQTETGNMAAALHDGYAAGTASGHPGRLTLSGTTVMLSGYPIDDKPLWDYLNPAAGGVNVSCAIGTVVDKTTMITCLQSWTLANAMTLNPLFPADGPTLFLESLDESPRFGWVPLFYQATLGAGNEDLNVDKYVPIFIQTTFWKCNAIDCDIIHDPGLALQGSNPVGLNKPVEASTALRMPRWALPKNIRDVEPGSEGAIEYVLVR